MHIHFLAAGITTLPKHVITKIDPRENLEKRCGAVYHHADDHAAEYRFPIVGTPVATADLKSRSVNGFG